MPLIATRQRAHELVEQLDAYQLRSAVESLEGMIQVACRERTLAAAPFDDEPVSEEENRQIAQALGKGVWYTHEEVLQELGMTQAMVESHTDAAEQQEALSR